MGYESLGSDAALECGAYGADHDLHKALAPKGPRFLGDGGAQTFVDVQIPAAELPNVDEAQRLMDAGRLAAMIAAHPFLVSPVWIFDGSRHICGACGSTLSYDRDARWIHG